MNLPRDEIPPCPGRADGEHSWVEATVLGEAGSVERYVCVYCRAAVAYRLPHAKSDAPTG